MEGGKIITLGQGQSHVSSSELDASHGSPKRVACVETELGFGTSSLRGRRIDPNMDPKKSKRALANRQYAQKNRIKKLQYVEELEGKVKALQEDVETLSPQVQDLQRHCSLMRRENMSMQRRISDLTGKLWCQEDEYKELKKERDMLKSQVHIMQEQQQQQHVGIMAATYEHGVQHMVNMEYPSQPMSPGLMDEYGATTLPNMNWEQSDHPGVQPSNFNFIDQDPFRYNYLM